MKNASCTRDDKAYAYEKLTPTRITESRHLKIGVETWGIITDYNIESVKINCYKPNEPSTTAVLKVSDEFGQAVCVIKGTSVGLLFDATAEEWAEIESLCDYKQQLFYRDFKDGLSKNYGSEQKFFYNFCKSNQTQNILVVTYERGVNTRNKDKSDVLLNIKELKKCKHCIINLYINYLQSLKC